MNIFMLVFTHFSKTPSFRDGQHRNIDRFPEDFMFELTTEEVSALR